MKSNWIEYLFVLACTMVLQYEHSEVQIGDKNKETVGKIGFKAHENFLIEWCDSCCKTWAIGQIWGKRHNASMWGLW